MAFHSTSFVGSTLGHRTGTITGLATPTLGPLVWVSSRDGSVRSINVQTGVVTNHWRTGAPASAVAVSPSGAEVIYGTSTGLVCLRRARDGALLQCMIAAEEAEISAIARSDYGESNVAIGTSKGRLSRLTLPGLAHRGDWQLASPIRTLAFNQDSLLIATGERLGAKPLWRGGGVFVQTNDEPRRCSVSETPTTALSWAGESTKTLVSGSAGGVLRFHQIIDANPKTIGERVNKSGDVTKLDEKSHCRTLRKIRVASPISALASHPSGALLSIGLWGTEPDTASVSVADYLYRTR